MSDPIAEALYGPNGPHTGGPNQAQIETGVARDSRPAPVFGRQQGASTRGPIDPSIAIYGRDGPVVGGPADSKVRQAVESGIARTDAAPPPGHQQQQGQQRGDNRSPAAQQAAAGTPFDPGRLTVPEGLAVDQTALAEFGNVARELRLDHKGAERLVQMHAKAVQQQYDQHTKTTESWANETRRHFGNDLPKVTADIRDMVGDDADGQEFLRMMEWSGLGSHPSVLKVLARLARWD